MSQTRRLAAILAVDVAGYSRLIGADEGGTLQALRTIRAELIDPTIAAHNGRLVKTTGDGLLVEFGSVVDALRCATAVQAGMADRNATTPVDKRIEFRIGINVGDVVVEDGDIFGDGVNVAARLEALAEPGGICVSARVQEDAAGKLDLTFEDMGEQTLKNIARPVRAYRIATGPVSAPPQETPVLALPDRPSIAVLPFANMSGDPEQEYFADGMVEEIITALSRIRWLFVIARNSSFTYKGQVVNVKQVGRELGVRYVLEGSVRKAGGRVRITALSRIRWLFVIARNSTFTYKSQAIDVKRVGRELGVRYVLEGSVRRGGGRVRITAQLIETETGAHLWADRFDGSLEDVFDLQDQVATAVAGVIEPTLQLAEVQRASRRPTNDLAAYDLYLRAYATMLSPARNIPEVLRLLDAAIARDPDFGPALAWAGICHIWIDAVDAIGGCDDPEGNRRRGFERGRRALLVARDDPAILANAAFALAYLGEDIGAMIALVDRALSLNPGFARGWHASGGIRLIAGQPDMAIEHVERSLHLSPRARVGWGLQLIGIAHFAAARFEKAIPQLLLGIQEDPNFATSYRYLAASYAHLGRLAEARETVGRLRAIIPWIGMDSLLRNPQQHELYVSGLRLAAGEAT